MCRFRRREIEATGWAAESGGFGSKQFSGLGTLVKPQTRRVGTRSEPFAPSARKILFPVFVVFFVFFRYLFSFSC